MAIQNLNPPIETKVNYLGIQGMSSIKKSVTFDQPILYFFMFCQTNLFSKSSKQKFCSWIIVKAHLEKLQPNMIS